MKLFIETNSGRLQNLYLLQDVRVVDSRIQENKFAVGYVQENGMCCHAAGRWAGVAAVHPDRIDGQAGRPLRRQVPDHRFSDVQLRQLRHLYGRRPDAVSAAGAQ